MLVRSEGGRVGIGGSWHTVGSGSYGNGIHGGGGLGVAKIMTSTFGRR